MMNARHIKHLTFLYDPESCSLQKTMPEQVVLNLDAAEHQQPSANSLK